jgi:hypothetical protein
MEIIGAGFGRTGTLSLQTALEELSFGPCYHMLEVFKHPGHIKQWQAAAEGKPVNWRAFLDGYRAGVDYPLAGFYRELMAAYPDAKVILTVRDPDRWYESTIQTIYKGTIIPPWLLRQIPPFRGIRDMINAAIWDRLFDGRFEDRVHAIRVFEEHIAEVRRVVPPEKLLVFEVREGWQPLCDFLSVPVPDKAFPHINSRKMTLRVYLAARVLAIILALSVIALVIWFITQIVGFAAAGFIPILN